MRTLLAALLLPAAIFCQSLAGRRAPGFSLTDSQSAIHQLSDYRGRWLILEFVHPDCDRCPALTKALAELKTRFGAGLDILGVVIPRQENTAAAVKFIQTANAGFPMAIDSTQLAIAYFQPTPGRPYYETPHWFAIDPDGNIAIDWAPDSAAKNDWMKELELAMLCARPGTNCPPAKHSRNDPPPPTSEAEALHRAARAGNLAQVQELIASGVPVDARDAMGGTPLHDAAWAGEKEVAAFLIESGADVNAKHAQAASTPLHYAVLTNHPDVVDLLLAHGADLNAPYQRTQSALHLAAARGYSRVATLLIAHGADIASRDETGATALSEASWTGETEMVKLLISKGADVNDVNPDTGMTALHAACSRGYAPVAKALLEAGARVDVRDKSGATPLYLALQFQRMDVVDLLIRDANLPRGQSIDVKAVLRDEVMRGRTNVVEMLLSRMPPLGSTTLLHDAALKGHVDVLELLLKHGAQVDSRNAQGATALHDAALAGQKAAAEVLIRHGANVNARDSESGETPLHRAASWGRRSVVELLLEQKADPRIKDKNGRTPLDLALANSQGDTAEVLKRIP